MKKMMTMLVSTAALAAVSVQAFAGGSWRYEPDWALTAEANEDVGLDHAKEAVCAEAEKAGAKVEGVEYDTESGEYTLTLTLLGLNARDSYEEIRDRVQDCDGINVTRYEYELIGRGTAKILLRKHFTGNGDNCQGK